MQEEGKAQSGDIEIESKPFEIFRIVDDPPWCRKGSLLLENPEALRNN